MFKSFDNGFCMIFENSVCVSVQFSNGHYCSNHSKQSIDKNAFNSCNNAEIAIFLTNTQYDKWLTSQASYDITGKGSDNVLGYVSPDELTKYLNWAKNYVDKDENN